MAADQLTPTDILQAFEVWEDLAQQYKQMVTHCADTGADMHWSRMSQLIDQMTDARDHWLDVSQQYCDEVASRGRG